MRVSSVELEKSYNDRDREYRHIVLDNELEVMLVSDPGTEKSAACLDVRVGSMQDEEVLGLAHFLEHMLFLGTETFPDEKEYSEYINRHGGLSNAYTTSEDTVYFFDVTSDHLDGALARFSAFFICPLFTESAVTREMNAVDSENSKNLQTDSWRENMLLSSLARSDHPYSKFSTGNLATLAGEEIDARGKCIRFHERHYSANVMKACIYGRDSLDELEKMALKYFQEVPNKRLDGPPGVPRDPYTAAQTGKVLRWVPVKDKNAVTLSFPIPSTMRDYEAKPGSYLAHLLGHESEGSVLAALKTAGLANELGAYEYTYASFGLFCVNIELTEEGVTRVDEVVAYVFAYIGMLCAADLVSDSNAWIGTELKDTYEMNFRFKSKGQPMDYVTTITNSMQDKKIEHIISGNSRIFDERADKAVALLEHLTPDNLLLLVKAKRFQNATDKKCPWYGTEYSESAFTAEQRLLWQSSRDSAGQVGDLRESVHLPKPNVLVPSNFDLLFDAKGDTALQEQRESQHAQPSVEVVSGMAHAAHAESEAASTRFLPHAVWHREDWVFRQPKVFVYAKVRSNCIFNDPAQQALADLYVNCAEELLVDMGYYAQCANLRYSLMLADEGLEINVAGYHHKLPLLVEEICKSMREMAEAGREGGEGGTPRPIFERMKDKLLRKYANEAFDMPIRQAMINTVQCLKTPRWSNVDKIDALRPLDLADLHHYSRQLLKQARVECMVYGNASKETASQYLRTIVNTLKVQPLPCSMLLDRRLVNLASNTDYYYRVHCADKNPDEVNNAIETCYFIGEGDYQPVLLTPAFLGDVGAELTPVEKEALGNMDKSIELGMLCRFLVHLMGDAAFHQLRTIEQLGYIVSVQGTESSGTGYGIKVLIQSDKQDAHYLDARIENFLTVFAEEQFEKELLEEGVFEAHRAALVEMWSEKSKNIGEEAYKQWDEISQARYDFDLDAKCTQLIRFVTLPMLVEFYQRYISIDSAVRTKMCSEYFAKDSSFPARECLPVSNMGKADTVLIEELGVARWKASMPLKASTKRHDLLA